MGIKVTSPATGMVAAVNRGAKRALISVIIVTEPDDFVTFKSHQPSDISGLTREDVKS